MSITFQKGMLQNSKFTSVQARKGKTMQREFYEPQQAAELLHCSEAWLRAGAGNCEFPHLVWGKGKIVFTDEHLEEIARLREVQPHAVGSSIRRTVGTRAKTWSA